MQISVVNLIKKLPIPFIYAASGYVAAEVPVLLSIVPSTIDGYSTASFVSGLMFIGSAAIWIHSELSPYIIKPSSAPLPSPQSSSAPSGSGAASQPTPSVQGLVLSASPNYIQAQDGQSISIVGSGFSPNTKGLVYDKNSGIGVMGFTSDANGNFAVKAVYEFNETQVSGLANAVQDDQAQKSGQVELIAVEYSDDKTSNVVAVMIK